MRDGRNLRSPKDTPQAAVTIASADTLDRKEVEKIIREYLLANPELLQEVQQALDAKQKEEQRVAQQTIISDAKDKIFNSAHDGVVGNPKGKITIVEFFDYNCGYCKRASRGHAGDDRGRSGAAFRAQGIPDPRTGFAEGQRGFDGIPQSDAGEIRRVPQPADRRLMAAPARRQPSRSPFRSAPTKPSFAKR